MLWTRQRQTARTVRRVRKRFMVSDFGVGFSRKRSIRWMRCVGVRVEEEERRKAA